MVDSTPTSGQTQCSGQCCRLSAQHLLLTRIAPNTIGSSCRQRVPATSGETPNCGKRRICARAIPCSSFAPKRKHQPRANSSMGALPLSTRCSRSRLAAFGKLNCDTTPEVPALHQTSRIEGSIALLALRDCHVINAMVVTTNDKDDYVPSQLSLRRSTLQIQERNNYERPPVQLFNLLPQRHRKFRVLYFPRGYRTSRRDVFIGAVPVR